MTDAELLKAIMKALIAEIWTTHRISVEDTAVDIITISLLDAITHIELMP